MRRREFIAGLGGTAAWPVRRRHASGADGASHAKGQPPREMLTGVQWRS